MPEWTRAQSDVLGFVFVFSIIALTTTAVYAGGFASLQDVRDAQRVDNAVRSVEVLADDLAEVRRGAPSRSTELKLDSASVTTGDPVTVNVTGYNVSEPTDRFRGEVDVEPVVYRIDGTEIVYAAGLVVRDDGGGRVAVREPDVVATSERVSLPVVQTQAGESRQVGGSTRVRVRSERGRSRTLATATGTGPYHLTLTVTSPRADVWYRTLDARPAVSCAMTAADEVACDVTTDRVVVTAIGVGVQLEA